VRKMNMKVEGRSNVRRSASCIQKVIQIHDRVKRRRDYVQHPLSLTQDTLICLNPSPLSMPTSHALIPCCCYITPNQEYLLCILPFALRVNSASKVTATLEPRENVQNRHQRGSIHLLLNVMHHVLLSETELKHPDMTGCYPIFLLLVFLATPFLVALHDTWFPIDYSQHDLVADTHSPLIHIIILTPRVTLSLAWWIRGFQHEVLILTLICFYCIHLLHSY
jgi:hypothetical protein